MFKQLFPMCKSVSARRSRAVAFGAAIATMTAATLFTGTGSASATIYNYGWTFRNRQSSDCLDAAGGASPGTRVIQWPCNGGWNQTWTLSHDSAGRPTLRSYNTDLCVDISGQSGANGASLILWYCNDGWNQVWEPKGQADWCQYGAYSFINPTTGRAIDNPGGLQDGAQMAAYDYWGGSNQVWC